MQGLFVKKKLRSFAYLYCDGDGEGEYVKVLVKVYLYVLAKYNIWYADSHRCFVNVTSLKSDRNVKRRNMYTVLAIFLLIITGFKYLV